MSHKPVWWSRARWNLLLIGLLLASVTLLMIPKTAFGADFDAASLACVVSSSDSATHDYTSCLPSGRWAGYIGKINIRTEPGKGVTGALSNIWQSVSNSVRLTIPNALLMLSQACWSTSLSLSQFAADFDPVNSFGLRLDGSIGNLVSSLMAGGIPAALIVVGIFAWVFASCFRVGESVSALKRIGVTILCLAMLIVTGAAATNSQRTGKSTVGSPSWVISTINQTMNTMTVSLDLDKLTDNNENMMAYSGGNNCQSYLAASHDMYDSADKAYNTGSTDSTSTTATSSAQASTTSSVTKAVNRMWEETALRSWVTMQWGNPVASNTTSTDVADNAQQAYCHVLEAYAGTDTETQRLLTNAEFHDNVTINKKTAQYLFDPSKGFIDPWNSMINGEDDAWDRGSDIYASRAGIFWETCTADNARGRSPSGARAGWRAIINNIGDEDTGAIKGTGGSYLRAKQSELTDSSGDRIQPLSDDSSPLLADSDTLCSAVFDNKIFQGVDNSDTEDRGKDKKDKEITDGPVGQAAALGWRFDVPNAGGTWREANVNLDSARVKGARDTIDYFYGNNDFDSLPMIGSLFGAIINMVVWGVMSLFLILAKLMLLFAALSYVLAYLIAAVPIGDKPRKVMLKWGKSCLSYTMCGTLYAIVGSIAVMICQVVINATGMMSGTFFYNLLTGCSPALALVIIAMTCSQLGLGNPLSIKAIAGIAGGGALYQGLSHLAHRQFYRGIARTLHGRVGTRRSNAGTRGTQRLSSTENGSGTATESATTIRQATSEQSRTGEGAEADTIRPDPGLAGEDREAEGEEAKTRWKDLDPASVRGAAGRILNDGRQAIAEGAEHHTRNMDDALKRNEERRQRTENRLFTRYSRSMPEEQARELAQQKSLKWAKLANIRTRVGAGAGIALTSAHAATSMALKAARSKPLRNAVRNGVNQAKPWIKSAAKVGVTAAMFTNPFTAGLGVLALGKTLGDRQVRSHAFKAVTGSVGLAARGVGALNDRFDLAGKAGQAASAVGGMASNAYETVTQDIPDALINHEGGAAGAARDAADSAGQAIANGAHHAAETVNGAVNSLLYTPKEMRGWAAKQTIVNGAHNVGRAVDSAATTIRVPLKDSIDKIMSGAQQFANPFDIGSESQTRAQERENADNAWERHMEDKEQARRPVSPLEGQDDDNARWPWKGGNR